MRIAHIKDGAVANISIAGDDWIAPDDATQVASDVAEIGDLFDGDKFVRPTPASPSREELLAALDRAHNAHLAKVWSFDVGSEGEPVHVTTRLDPSGQSAMLQIQAWAAMLAQPGDVLPYSNIDFTSAVLTKEQALTLAVMAGAAKIASFATLNAAAAKINAEPPQISTLAELAAIEW